ATSKVEQNCDKKFYVSPFLGMDMSYTFHVSLPEERVSIAIHGKERDEPVILASLSGKRRELSEAALLKAFFTHPLLTLKIHCRYPLARAAPGAEGLPCSIA